MSKFRSATDTVAVPTDFYEPFGPYSDEAGPDPDARREQLASPAEQLDRVEPDVAGDDLDREDVELAPVVTPYRHPEPPAPKSAPAEVRPTDGVARTVTVGDDPVLVLTEDGRRRSWSVWVNSASSAGVRLAIGRHAREDVTADPTSIPLAAGAALDGETGAPVAVISATPGTAATVHVVAELDGIA